MITRLTLKDFRNYANTTFDFTEKNIVLFGDNGKGKTNILEAISLLSVGRSWRESSPADLIREGATNAIVQANDSDGNNYQVMITSRSRSFSRNQKKQSFKKFFGNVPTLLFVPEYLTLFSAAKRDRQKFFDRFLFQISPQYREDLTRCNKAVKQKNALLKSYKETVRTRGSSEFELSSLIAPWNQILSETIPRIAHERMDLLKKLTPLVQDSLQEMSHQKNSLDIQLVFPEKCEMTTEKVMAFFEYAQPREIAAQKCLLGPQRDDFAFSFRGKPLTSTASRGETRSVLLALLVAQKKMFYDILHQHPLLLLDDVFSELDQFRQDTLENLCNESQIFFTTTHESHFENFSHTLQRVEIK
ncbi:DNA replication and repair protein RecF [Candidatus Gracilibacteria bacterium]|nr:DNA replication and repair protein RecF [Candidatus Gracilibacteria bacterium]